LRGLLLVLLLCAPAALHSRAGAQIPAPESHFGHRMGAPKELLVWRDVLAYFSRLDRASDHVKVQELGRTTEGRPLILAVIASPETLDDLETYQRMQSALADPRRTSPAEAERLARAGKTVVFVTCSIHSTEAASTLSAIEFVHRLLTGDTRRHRAILENTIFLLAPSLNPDGLDKVTDWYERYLGTPYEGAPMTELYHRYAGHDINRDWYRFALQETRLAVEKVHNVWRPQIVYDLHQMGAHGARMFLPPWIDPIDPNIDPLIVQQTNMLGTAMAADLTAQGKTGVVVNAIYDSFTPARHYPSYHGGIRLLSEAASVKYATPVHIPFSSLEAAGRGYSPREASWNFVEPWPGGEWRLEDIVDYQAITLKSCLYQAAVHREDLLRNFYRIGQRVAATPSPWGFVIPREQHDPSALTELLEILRTGLVEIEQAAVDFKAAGRTFNEGDYLVRMRQPYASFAKTLLERQFYPEREEYPGGPLARPYDATAHSLPLLMGVDVFPVEQEPEEAEFSPAFELFAPAGRVAGEAAVVSLSPAPGYSWKAVNRLLQEDVPVYRDRGSGVFYIPNQDGAAPLLDRLAESLGLRFEAAETELDAHRKLRTPRVGVYQGHVPMIDEGWTRWALDEYEFPYRGLGNARIQQGDLASEFDVIVLPDAPPSTLQAGYIAGALYDGAEAPPEYTGGIETEGARELRRFVLDGGTLLALNRASRYAMQRLRAPAQDALLRVPSSDFSAPGTLLFAEFDTSHPLCFGMRRRQAVWFESGPAFQIEPYARGAEVFGRYPRRDILASGWLQGEEFLAERAAAVDLPLGRGHLVLFGLRPQYRGQSNAAFKLLFNGLFYFER